MFQNYITIAIRNAIRNKTFTLINILGLSIGIACSLYITYWVRDELSYDKFHDNSDRIYRIYWQSENSQTRTPHPMAQALAYDFPEVENAVSLSPIWGPGLTIPTITVEYGDKKFDEKGFYSADTTFFKVFSFKLLKGNPETALKEPGGIIISERMSKKYFGNEDPMDKMVTFIHGDKINLKVTGVIENVPSNSHFKFDFLVSYVTLKMGETGEYYTWEDFGHFNYILLKDKAAVRKVEESLFEWSKKFIQWPDQMLGELEIGTIGFKLQSLTDIHLHSHLKWELEQNGDFSYIWILSSLAILIILIACINFMNLSTAKSSKRTKEIGIRKVSGASKLQVVVQFIGESFITVIISLIVAIILFEIFRPAFNGLTLKQITINYTQTRFFVDLLILLIVITILAGVYPAFFMSKFKPNDIFKGKVISNIKGITFRRLMVIFQFSISTLLIICTLIISNQIKFLNQKKLGLDSSQIIVVPIKDRSLLNNLETFQKELLKSNYIQKVAATSNIPGRQFNQNPLHWAKTGQTIDVSELHIDYNFLSILDLKMKEGRKFSPDFRTDSLDAFILNETAASLFDWKNPINEIVTWEDNEIDRRGRVIGIIENFHFQSLHKNIAPLLIRITPRALNYLLLKIDVNNLDKVNNYVRSKIEEMNYNFDYDYFFLDQDISTLYKSENQMQKLFFYFTVFAIFISCLGLFGLALFMTEQRTKEIGIRRVHGASISKIMVILSAQFLKWVLVAIVIAVPLAYYAMNNWLQGFAYRTDIKFWAFIVATFISFTIALITISFQTYKTAIKNPAESLRYE